MRKASIIKALQCIDFTQKEVSIKLKEGVLLSFLKQSLKAVKYNSFACSGLIKLFKIRKIVF